MGADSLRLGAVSSSKLDGWMEVSQANVNWLASFVGRVVQSPIG